MTILGSGDLSPRRHNRGSGRGLVVVGAVVVLAVVAFFGIKALTGGSSGGKPAALPFCKAAAVIKPPKPKNVHLSVLNGTETGGLAAEVANDLEARGFHVSSVGNTKSLIKAGDALVSYGPGKLLAAQAVAAEFANAKLVQGTVPGVQLGVGPAFTALAGTSAVSAARQQYIQSDAPTTPTPAPTATPTCRPTEQSGPE